MTEDPIERVREADVADFAQLIRLYRQLQPDDPVLTDGKDAAVFRQIVEQPGLILFVLDTGERLLRASCYLNLIPNLTRRASPYAIIENVITDESYRGLGYGRRVIGHALQHAWSAGAYKAMLQTGSRQESTHAFYRTCGFSADDKTGYVARPPGNGSGNAPAAEE